MVNILQRGRIMLMIKYMYVCMYVYGHTCSKSMDQPGKVANPARVQLNRENEFPLSAFVPHNLVSRDGFSVKQLCAIGSVPS